jgi:hypothetical protein
VPTLGECELLCDIEAVLWLRVLPLCEECDIPLLCEGAVRLPTLPLWLPCPLCPPPL